MKWACQAVVKHIKKDWFTVLQSFGLKQLHLQTLSLRYWSIQLV